MAIANVPVLHGQPIWSTPKAISKERCGSVRGVVPVDPRDLEKHRISDVQSG